MLEFLKKIDQDLLLLINSKHNFFFDEVMSYSTERFFWIPLYALLVAFLIWKFKKQGLVIIFCLAITIIIADQISSSIFKPVIGRLRPCHEPMLKEQLRLIKGCGGTYGFVSSHASNSFALATVLIILLYRKYKWIVLFVPWAGLVSYSRIYLGVHYPGDILAGAILGVCIGICTSFLYTHYLNFYLIRQKL